MDFEKLMKMIDAGFTRDDVMAIITAASHADSNIFSPAPEPGPEPAPAGSDAAPDADSEPAAEDPLEEIKAQIAELSTTITSISKAVINPTLSDVKPLGAEDVIVNFFKEL